MYSQVENWRYLDSIYFTVVTLTTIGYGDFAPQTDIGKVFTIFFSLAGIGLAFYFFSMVGRYMFRKQLRDRLAEEGRLRTTKGIKKVSKKLLES